MKSKKDLKDIVDGLFIDIFAAQQALALDKLIGKNAEQIKAGGFEELFGSLQDILVRHFILAINRLFERNSNKYNIRSIPAALDILKKSTKKIEIKDKIFLIQKMEEFGYKFNRIELCDLCINRLVVNHFDKKLSDNTAELDSISQPLEALKTARDKQIAHHEAIKISEMPTTTYAKIEELLDLAKCFAVTIGCSYVGKSCEDSNGNYFASSDADLASCQLNKLFNRLKLESKDLKL